MSEKKYGSNTAEVEAYLALLPKLTDEQWAAARPAERAPERVTARVTAWNAAWTTARAVARAAEWDAARSASWAAIALVTRDLITPKQFDVLTAPMRAAGIDFDALMEGR